MRNTVEKQRDFKEASGEALREAQSKLNDYLEGCYKLGQHYLDLCSSIFLMREKGAPRG
jgi:hypothetical protein